MRLTTAIYATFLSLSFLAPASSYAGPSQHLPENMLPSTPGDRECVGLATLRGPGSFSIYTGGRNYNPRNIALINFWIQNPDDPNKFDPDRHIDSFGPAVSAPPATFTVIVDPCNRQYGAYPNPCRTWEGHPAVNYVVGQPLTWVDPDGVTQTLLDEPLNYYTYPASNGVDDVQNHMHWYRTGFNTAKSTYCDIYVTPDQISPLVIDFAGNGIKFTAKTTIVRFDLGQEGAVTSWVANPDEVAFIALDRNGNGEIDDVQELFGNSTVSPDGETAADGFLALAHYDSNKDGVIDSKDEIFKKLLLWNDLNSNGKSEANELQPLASKVTAIKLGHDGKTYFKDKDFNHAVGKAEVTTVGGDTVAMYDAWFTLGVDPVLEHPEGEASPAPNKQSEKHAQVRADLASLMEEDGWKESDVAYERGLNWTKKNSAEEVESYTLRWNLVEGSKCFAQLLYSAEWVLKDKVVACE